MRTKLNTKYINIKTRIDNLFIELKKLDIDCNGCVMNTPYTVYDIGRIANKKVYILDQKVEEFSKGLNYLNSISKLLYPWDDKTVLTHGENKVLIPDERKKSYFNDGFMLSEEEKQIIRENKYANNTMLQILLNLDKDPKYILIKYEITKKDTFDTINNKLTDVLTLSYYLIGKLFGVISNQLHYEKNTNFVEDISDLSDIHDMDPIEQFLLYGGIIKREEKNTTLYNSICAGFKQMALSHISHGMSSAELVARVASSVRTSYTLALISALCVRSGVYHGGAMQKAMPMIDKYLKTFTYECTSLRITNQTIDTNECIKNKIFNYINLLFTTTLYGFGHRIHKSPDMDKPCADPRALEYLEIIDHIYKDTKPLELKLIKLFLDSVKKINSRLGCNSDFAIAVFCVLTNVPINCAEGMFVMCRIPGLCARIVRELLGKPNARRLPFAPILPYIRPLNDTTVSSYDISEELSINDDIYYGDSIYPRN